MIIIKTIIIYKITKLEDLLKYHDLLKRFKCFILSHKIHADNDQDM